MFEETKATLVRLPAEVLWDYLSDYDHVVRLGWETASAEPLRRTVRCYARFKVTVDWEGIDTTYTACLEESDRPRLLTWSTREAMATSWVRFVLEPQDSASTLVNVTLHFETAMLVSATEPAAWDLLRPSLLRTLVSLERLHEDHGAVHSGTTVEKR